VDLDQDTEVLTRIRYPPTTEEKKAALYGWFSTRGPALGVEKAPKILADIEAAYGKKTWAALGV